MKTRILTSLRLFITIIIASSLATPKGLADDLSFSISLPGGGAYNGTYPVSDPSHSGVGSVPRSRVPVSLDKNYYDGCAYWPSCTVCNLMSSSGMDRMRREVVVSTNSGLDFLKRQLQGQLDDLQAGIDQANAGKVPTSGPLGDEYSQLAASKQSLGTDLTNITSEVATTKSNFEINLGVQANSSLTGAGATINYEPKVGDLGASGQGGFSGYSASSAATGLDVSPYDLSVQAPAYPSRYLAYAADLQAQAQAAVATGHLTQAVRLSDRINALTAYNQGAQAAEPYRQTKLDSAAGNLYGVTASSTNFEGYQLVLTTNALGANPAIAADPAMYFTAKAAVVQALNQINAAAGGSINLGQLFRNLDQAWSVVDLATSLGQNLDKGIAIAVVNFATGSYQMVRHPVDSLENLGHVLWNIDIVMKSAYDSVANFATTQHSAGDVVQLEGQVAANIMPLLTGAGFVGTGADQASIDAAAAQFADEAVPLLSSTALRGMQKLQQLVPDLLGQLPNEGTDAIKLAAAAADAAPDAIKAVGAAAKGGLLNAGDAADVLHTIGKHWDTSFTVTGVEDADISNAQLFADRNLANPYRPDTAAVRVVLSDTVEFVRVHVNGVAMADGSIGSNAIGSWITKKSDIIGLSPAEVQSMFALPVPPTHISDVLVPSGAQLRVGVVGPNFGSAGGGIQFELTSRIPPSSFQPGILIKGVVQ